MLSGPFANMQTPNGIQIKFGRKALRRFGSIKMTRDKKVSLITINGHFRDPQIPEEIILATLAHELSHYAHGFCSPLKQKYKYPHQGGVIEKEMRSRGLGHLYDFEKKWTKANWPKILGPSVQKKRTHRSPRRRKKDPAVTILKALVKLLS
jgi:hypothetical protein